MRKPREEPTLGEERAFQEQGYRWIAGVDEAGRGSIAGPVVAAAVILPLDSESLRKDLAGVRDSKQLTEKRREGLYEAIQTIGVSVGVGVVSSTVIDNEGIVPATEAAMEASVAQLDPDPDVVLVDGRLTPSFGIVQKQIIGGDAKCLSIATASIIAKVYRDRMMIAFDKAFPGYGLTKNKGYGTRAHRESVLRLGPSPIHRYSFSPLKHRFEVASER